MHLIGSSAYAFCGFGYEVDKKVHGELAKVRTWKIGGDAVICICLCVVLSLFDVCRGGAVAYMYPFVSVRERRSLTGGRRRGSCRQGSTCRLWWSAALRPC
jgi:hypothetical protein